MQRANRHMKRCSANHERNANQNHGAISPHICQSGCHQKEHKWRMLASVRRRGKSSTLLVGTWIGTATMEKYGGFSEKRKIVLPYDPAIPLLGIYKKKKNTNYKKYICISVFIAALFVTVKIWKQHKCPSTDTRVEKMWYIYNGIL